jgi:hypothetical protein
VGALGAVLTILTTIPRMRGVFDALLILAGGIATFWWFVP